MNRHKIAYLGTASWAVLLVTTLFLSCTDDDYMNNKSQDNVEYISFGVSDDAGSADTRATEQNDKQKFVLRGDNDSDTICVSSTISDHIMSVNYGESDSQTRAMPVITETLESFGVLGLVSGGNLAAPDYLMYNEEITKSGKLWTSHNVYYWPGSQYTLKFYAYAPFNCDGVTLPDSGDPTNRTLSYIVPDDATNQQDLMVAVTGDFNGVNEPNKKVNLTFSHLCTAVRFVIGDEIQPGTIKSISLKNVYGSGDYAMDTQQWNNLGSLKDFAQEPQMSTGGATPGTGIIYDGTTYMMIPQQLPANAEIEIIFADATGERTLSASIAGTQWPMGETVTYRLSITPEYTLEFASDPVVQDAHYIIYPIKIRAEDVKGGWTLTSPNPLVTLRTNLTELQEDGYWIEDDKGDTSISGTTTTGEITVYAFLWENIGEEARKVTLELRPTNNPNATPATFTIEQLYPAWNGDIGCGTH